MRSTKYCFDEFELHPASRDLLRNGERVALPPKSFECLAYLLTHRDRAVGRDELISAVWGRVEVSDTVVAQTLLRARKAIGDSGARQLLIRTVPRFGYRWIAPVFADALDTPTARMPHAPAARDVDTVRGTARTWIGWGTMLMLMSAAAFAGWLLPDSVLSAAGDMPLLRRAAAQIASDSEHALRTDLVRLTDACRLALRERGARGGECVQTLCASSSKSTDVGSLGGCATAPVKQVQSREGAVPPRVRHAD
jgi:DNA-binding winged helix-turn-helix (wHTH) protein